MVLGFVLLCSSCATTDAAKKPKLKPVSPELAALTVSLKLLSHAEGDPLFSFRSALMSAGYQTAGGSDTQADILLRVVVNSKEEVTALSVMAPMIVGVPRIVSKLNEVRVDAISLIDGVVIDQVDHAFSGDDGSIPTKEFEVVERALRANGKLERHARKLAKDRKAVAKQQAQERDEAAQRRKFEEAQAAADAAERKAAEARKIAEAEEHAWSGAGLSSCAAPLQSTACDAVQSYVNAYPAGKYIDEAKRTLAVSAAAIAKLDDDERWKLANAPGCKKAVASTDCDAVDNYATNYPEGRHAGEALTVLKAAVPKIAALKLMEERRAEAAGAIGELCEVLNQEEQIAEAQDLNRRVDAASGTVNLHQKRQLATARLFLGDQKKKLSGQIARGGVRFDRRRDCSGSGDDDE